MSKKRFEPQCHNTSQLEGVARNEKFYLEKLELSLQTRAKRYVVNTLQKLRQNYVWEFFFNNTYITNTEDY